LVIRVVKDGKGLALLTGDAQIPALRRILLSGGDISADVLVVPHHGSASSLLPEFYDAVAPQIALITCGEDNSYGFPKPEVVDALRQRGIEVWDTATSGELRVVWTDAAGMRFSSFR
jgi:competence protein ComEC